MRAGIPWLLMLALGLAPAASTAGEVAGRVSLEVEGARLASQGPVAVYLESAGGGDPAPPPERRRVIRQSGAHFVPEFLVVAAGTTVEMPNEDTIVHNVFSPSRPNDFDLGVYPEGESRSVPFAHPGLVRLYCSIHASMQGTVLVTPSRWFSVASPSGAYRIRDVPPGSYLLHVWNERLPALVKEIAVPDGAVRVDVTLGVPAP